MNRIFVSSLGAPSRGYHEEKYSLGDKSARSRFAPAALAQLLDLRGWNAVVLVTPKALENHYDSLSAELASLGLQPRHAQISESLRPDDIQSILETINQIVPDAARVVLDITYGFRHLPMIHLVSLAYLVPLKQVEVQGIYYGAREAGGAFVNLSGLFDVIRWAHAIEAFREIGDLRLVAARLRETVSRQARAGRTDPAAQAAQSEAERFSRFLSAGLPLEVGLSARELDSRIQALSPDTAPRLVRRTLDALEPLLKPWIIKGDHSEKKTLRSIARSSCGSSVWSNGGLKRATCPKRFPCSANGSSMRPLKPQAWATLGSTTIQPANRSRPASTSWPRAPAKGRPRIRNGSWHRSGRRYPTREISRCTPVFRLIPPTCPAKRSAHRSSAVARCCAPGGSDAPPRSERSLLPPPGATVSWNEGTGDRRA